MQRPSHIFVTLLLATALLIPAAALAQAADEQPPIIAPTLQVPIPGLNFEGSVIVTGQEGQGDCAANSTCVYTIERYLNAVFKYGVGAGVIFCIVLIMIGGVEWMVGSAVGGIARAQKRIKNASMGLLLLLGVATILAFINPAITALNMLSIESIKRAAPDPPKEAVVGNAAIQTDIQNNQGETVNTASIRLLADGKVHPNIESNLGVGAELVHKDMVEPLHRVANALKDATGKKLFVLAAFADPAQTARRFYELCIKANCSEIVCNPLAGTGVVEGSYDEGFRLSAGFQQEVQEAELNEEGIVELLAMEAAQNTNRSCPYETGYAVAVLCDGARTTSVSNLACQVQLETLMKAEGFCRSYYQPWHYEKKGKQTSVTLCNWIPGTMKKSGSQCTGDGPSVEYTTAGQRSACAVNYGNRVDSCLRWNMELGYCERESTAEYDYSGG